MATLHRPVTHIQPTYEQGKQLAQRIFMATLARLAVRRTMIRKLQFGNGVLKAGGESIPVLKPRSIIALGKAAARMAATMDELLGGAMESGVVVAPAEPVQKSSRFRYFVGGHPYPSSGSLEGATAALELVSHLSSDDL